MGEPPILAYADPDATETIELPGGCPCPGRPHERESAVIRTQLGAGERASIAVAGWSRARGDFYDWEAAKSELVATAVVSWTYLRPGSDDEPVPLPIDWVTVHRRLPGPAREALAKAINAAHAGVLEAEASLPNASGAPSRGSTRGSASRTRTTPRTG